MKKIVLSLIVLSVFLLPTALLAQPPRPHQGYGHQGRPGVARPGHHTSLQVHVPPRVDYRHYETRRPPMPPPYAPYYGPHHGHYHGHYHPPVVVQPEVIVVPRRYVPAVGGVAVSSGGVSVSVGGPRGGFSFYSGY